MSDVDALISLSAILIGLYLILTIRNGDAFKGAFTAVGGLFTQSVGTLMGPSRITKGG